jgi:hypothetical protein
MQRLSAAVVGIVFLGLPHHVRADAFDNYTNEILLKVPKAKGAEKIQKLTPEMMVQNSRVLPGVPGTFLVVVNQEGRMSKLLVQPARQKVGQDATLPIFLIERFVTFKDGEERAIHAQGKMVRLFTDFHFDLDMGQVVPAKLGGDLRFVARGEESYVEPVGKAEMYLVTEHVPAANAKKVTRPEIGAKFEPRFFEGEYKLYDDGRRSGTMHLNKVAGNGDVLGVYYSDTDGRKYEVSGKVGNPAYAIQFRITYPRTVQFFQGLMFTGDGRAIAGSSRLQDRETGFYAVRVEK